MDEASREDLKRKLRLRFEAQMDAMVGEIEKFDDVPCAKTFYNLEKKVNAALDRIGDEIAKDAFRRKHEAEEFLKNAVESSKKNTGCTTGEGKPQSSS